MNNSICTLFDNILIDIHKFKSLHSIQKQTFFVSHINHSLSYKATKLNFTHHIIHAFFIYAVITLISILCLRN